jgi:putative hydrolase of the HAD superfamily
MLADIQAVVFDLDGTLLDRRLSFERFIRDQWRRYSPVLESADQTQYVQSAVEYDLDGYAPRKALFTRTLSRFNLPVDLAETLLEDYRARFPGSCLLFADAAPTLMSLREAGFKLGLITNGSVRMQSGKIACLALASAFDAVLISEAEGISKPDPAIFRRALERLSTKPEHAVFVGDHPIVDVSGARSAGMKAVWRRNGALPQEVEADSVIETVSELLVLLGIGTPGREDASRALGDARS